MTPDPGRVAAIAEARASLGIGADNMVADDDWLMRQLAAWPHRIDPEKTTSLRFLIESAALTLFVRDHLLAGGE